MGLVRTLIIAWKCDVRFGPGLVCSGHRQLGDASFLSSFDLRNLAELMSDNRWRLRLKPMA